jgi:hypothetical protein
MQEAHGSDRFVLNEANVPQSALLIGDGNDMCDCRCSARAN